MKVLKTIKEYAVLTLFILCAWILQEKPKRRFQSLSEAAADCEEFIAGTRDLEGLSQCEQYVYLKIAHQHKHHPNMKACYEELQAMIDDKMFELQMVERSQYAFVAEQKALNYKMALN